MCAEVLKEVSKGPMKKVQPLTYEHDPKKIAPTIASLPAPPTSELVELTGGLSGMIAIHWMKNRICTKFALCKPVANIDFV